MDHTSQKNREGFSGIRYSVMSASIGNITLCPEMSETADQLCEVKCLLHLNLFSKCISIFTLANYRFSGKAKKTPTQVTMKTVF